MTARTRNTNTNCQLKALLFFLLLFVLVSFHADAFPEIKKIHRDIYTRFTDFTPILGTLCGTIVDIEQDRFGNIWLAGTRGLAKFNGSKVKYYQNDWTPGSLPSSAVYCLEMDSFGRMWVGTRNGLCYYDYKKDVFKKVIGPDTSQIVSDTFFIRKILTEGDSLLWFDTRQGWLWKLDLNTFQVIKMFRHRPSAQPYYLYHALYRDRDGILWLGGRTLGPCYLDEQKNRVIEIAQSLSVEIKGKKRGRDVAYFYHDEKNNLWIGSTDGIYFYDKKTALFKTFLHTSSRAFFRDHKGNLWLDISGGLACYHPVNGELITYFPEEQDRGSLLGSMVTDIFEDHYQQLWIATQNGVSVLKRQCPGVQYMFHIPEMDETPVSSSITSLAVDSSGKKVWVGTEHSGLMYFDPFRNTYRVFNTKNTKGMPSDNIRCIALSPEGKVFCGLWAGVGFGELHPEKTSFTCYTYRKENTHKDWYNDLQFDKNGRLYLGFWGGDGLIIFDYKKGIFKRNLASLFSPPFPSRLMTTLSMDQKGNLWVGTTSNGLHVYFPKGDSAVGFLPLLKERDARNLKKVFVVKTGPSGKVWVGAHGLFTGTSEPLSLKKIKMDERFQNLDVYGILPENKDLVWLLTNWGLLRYNYLSGGMINYASTVKLKFDEDHASGVRLKDGRFLFGGKNGMALVDAEKVKLNPAVPSVYLSSLLVFDKTKVADIENKDTIKLSHKENFFTIRIGSDVWSSDQTFRFFYKLEGFNKEWVALPSSEREAHFTNVPPGDYIFRVKIEDKLGNKYNNIAECNLSIIPPFWNRWWFFVLLVFVLFSLSYYFWWSRMKSLRLSLFNSELNQKLLRLQMNPHFIFNSLFAIQSYIYSSQIHRAGNYLSDFAHLIRLILDNSRSELIPFEKELETVLLYLKLQKLRFEDKFDYVIEADEELKNGEYEIPPMLAQPFLENAIEHGLKNLDRKGRLIIRYRQLNGMIRFELEDNGIGLTAGQKQKERSKTEHESLAISICKRRLEILRKKRGGEITFLLEEIKNSAGEVLGTRVAFNIPI